MGQLVKKMCEEKLKERSIGNGAGTPTEELLDPCFGV